MPASKVNALCTAHHTSVDVEPALLPVQGSLDSDWRMAAWER